MLKSSLICFFLLFIACLLPTKVFANQASWPEVAFSYYANDTKIQKVLKDFSENFSIKLNIDKSISGVVNGRFNSPNPTDFLNRLGSIYGFTWFNYAGNLYISRSNDIVTRAINARGGSIARLRQALFDLGVLDEKFGWGELPERGVALVSGPATYVSLIEKTIKQLPESIGRQEVRVFRLKHASVLDRTITYRDKQIAMPGLATILRNLIIYRTSNNINSESFSSINAIQSQANTRSSFISHPDNDSNKEGMAPLPPNYDELSKWQPGNDVISRANPQRNNQMIHAKDERVIAPSIEADPRLNAIIVQDTPDRMPIYQKLIDELDRPSALIEIEAQIIDVQTDHLSELGIAWGARAGNVAFGYGNLSQYNDGNGDLSFVKGASSAIVNPTTIVTNVGNYLSSRIHLLEKDGFASVLATPSILTVDNLSAVLDLSDTFYIPVKGERVANVTPVTVGTTLNVTPRFVNHSPTQSIELTVDIEDGKILGQTVNDLPIVRRSSIGTQALVNENETLVIAGYNNTENGNGKRKVPFLGDVPILGALFSNKTRSTNKTERLFMITPKLINIPTELETNQYSSTNKTSITNKEVELQADVQADMASRVIDKDIRSKPDMPSNAFSGHVPTISSKLVGENAVAKHKIKIRKVATINHQPLKNQALTKRVVSKNTKKRNLIRQRYIKISHLSNAKYHHDHDDFKDEFWKEHKHIIKRAKHSLKHLKIRIFKK